MDADTPKRSEIISELFMQYSNDIYRYARYSLPSDVDAKDVVQEVFLRAFRAWDRFEGNANVKTWLLSIARNYIYDLLRQKRRQRLRETELTEDRYTGMNLNTIVELEDALSRLHPNYQQVLVLRWIQDMSVADAAKVLDWSEAKVTTTFHRARKKLLKELRDNPELSLEFKGGDTANEK